MSEMSDIYILTYLPVPTVLLVDKLALNTLIDSTIQLLIPLFDWFTQLHRYLTCLPSFVVIRLVHPTSPLFDLFTQIYNNSYSNKENKMKTKIIQNRNLH